MKLPSWVQLFFILTLYFICVIFWNAEQILGIGKTFLYALF